MNRGFCEADKTVGRGFSAYIVVLEHEQIPLLSRGGVAATSREFREATLVGAVGVVLVKYRFVFWTSTTPSAPLRKLRTVFLMA